MNIFGKKRLSLRIKNIRASRAVFIDLDTQEIEITFLTEDNEKLTLQMPPRLAHKLVTELVTAYEAINPPLRSGNDYAQWDGMNDNG